MEKDIDLVYLWVDNTDSKWLDKISKYRKELAKYNADATSTCRFQNNDELKFSLRSVEKNIPWVRNIYIVTDNQIPSWLNLDNKKIKIIDHKDIIPNNKLPLFNSCAIETRIPYIQDLSEYFLYANDDMLVWEPVEKDFFFDDQDRAICRLDKPIKKNKGTKHLYGYTIKRAYDIISKNHKLPIKARFPHHNIDSYRKSAFLECIKEYSIDFEETLNHRFREHTDMQRMSITFYMLATGYGVPKYTKEHWFKKYILNALTDSKCYHILESSFKSMKKAKCKLMCINDCRKTTDKDRVRMIEFLEQRFPQKSEFEK